VLSLSQAETSATASASSASSASRSTTKASSYARWSRLPQTISSANAGAGLRAIGRRRYALPALQLRLVRSQRSGPRRGPVCTRASGSRDDSYRRLSGAAALCQATVVRRASGVIRELNVILDVVVASGERRRLGRRGRRRPTGLTQAKATSNRRGRRRYRRLSSAALHPTGFQHPTGGSGSRAKRVQRCGSGFAADAREVRAGHGCNSSTPHDAIRIPGTHTLGDGSRGMSSCQIRRTQSDER
jgi:hypothetical protein